ncbi:hypothetical protein M9H77_13719 [Catharanthus roseus]|uniref:Uncharacterized protein n=1 Tax=Catharanthus roseus TaxID=4058 RepID=A0ACC0BKY6_CATRO|nr:hypothetical protein M9H77_13719 [Catharanthus roseus]
MIWNKRIRTFAYRYQKQMPYHLVILHRAVMDGERGKGEAGLKERAVQGCWDITISSLLYLLAILCLSKLAKASLADLYSLRCLTELVGFSSTKNWPKAFSELLEAIKRVPNADGDFGNWADMAGATENLMVPKRRLEWEIKRQIGGNDLLIIGGPSLFLVTELSTELFRFWNSTSNWGFQFVKYGVGSYLSLKFMFKGGRSRGPRFRSPLDGGRFLLCQATVCWGGQGRWIRSRGDAYASSLSIGFPSFSVSGKGDKGENYRILWAFPAQLRWNAKKATSRGARVISKIPLWKSYNSNLVSGPTGLGTVSGGQILWSVGLPKGNGGMQRFSWAERRLSLECKGIRKRETIGINSTLGVFDLIIRADMSANLIHVWYISLLEDFDAIYTYGKGNCVLGFLYRCLCKLDRYVEQDLRAPLDALWCTLFDLSQLPIHVLLTYLDQLDFMASDQEVDNMTTRVLEGPPSSPAQYTSVMRKVQIILRRCMISLTFAVQPSHRRPQQLVPKHGARGVKKDAIRLPGGRAHGGCAPTPPHPGRQGRVDLGSYVPHDPFDSPSGDASIFSLGLTPITLSHRVEQSQTFSDVQNISMQEDHSNVRQYVTAITQMVFYELSMLYPDIEEDGVDDDIADAIMTYPVHLTKTLVIMMRKMTIALP